MKTPNTATKTYGRLLRRLEREYDRAICAEENAVSEAMAWRLAGASERCLRRLQAARAGLPLPEPKTPATAANRARQGLAALATVGRAIGRALTAKAALAKAHAANALRRAAGAAAKLARQALRRTLRTIAAQLSPAALAIEALVASLSFSGEGLTLSAIIEGEWISFLGGRWGSASLSLAASSPERITAHWRGYVENNRRTQEAV